MVGKSIFDNSVSYKQLLGSNSNVINPNPITEVQLVALEKTHNSYTSYLAEKEYQNISSNYGNYINLLAVLNSIEVVDPKLKILIKISIDGLMGSLNSISIFNQYAFKELTLIELNNRITDILSKKNMQKAMDTVSSTMHAIKVITLNPLFSYYISLYGMPNYGVGFDAAKLAFLQNIKK